MLLCCSVDGPGAAILLFARIPTVIVSECLGLRAPTSSTPF